MGDVREEAFRACTRDVDRNDGITAAAVFDFFQEVAANHAEELGVGNAWLRDRGLAWILSRMSVEVDLRPGRGSGYLVRTWPRGTDKIFAVRDYELVAPDGRTAARGRSAWLIVDVAAQRPRRPEAFAAGLPLNEGRDALAGGAAALKAREGLLPAGRRSASYSDIDYNGHVNNARYVQWAQDVLPVADQEAARSFRVDVNYLAEVRPGQALDLFAGRVDAAVVDGAAWAVEGRHEDGAPSFRAEFVLRP